MPPRPRSTGAPGDRDPVASEAVFAAAVELVTSSSASFQRTARRFSLCAHDAEDAYQRSLEILLTKAPTARREELRPWLHTVIKHEALALRRQRERSVSGDEEAAGADALAAPDRGPDDAATGRERVQRTAEALRALKPGEIQCMVLKALGYSYEEIAARTGFSWTKVNRSLTEGRRRFFERFGEIAAGAACHDYQPLLSAACDGHARREERSALRAHLAACPACRASLREYRSAPARLAELLPPAVVLPLLERAGWWQRLHDWAAVTAGERSAAIGLKLQQGAEAVSAQKAAAVVASTAALAGGGAAVHEAGPARERAPRAERPAAAPARAAPAALARVAAAPVPAEQRASVSASRPSRARHRPAGRDRAASEFGFEGGGRSPAPQSPAGRPPAREAGRVRAAAEVPAGELAPAPAGGVRAAGAAAGEFGP